MRVLPKPLKELTKAVVSPVLDATGLYGRRISHVSAQPGSWTIVMYHRVIDDPAKDPFRLGMCVLRDRFERQVRYLHQRFNIITAIDAATRLARGEPLPPRALSITFDDGYLDNLTHALPIMQRHDVPFSVYVPTGGLESGCLLWWDKVIAMLAATRRTEIDLQEVGLSSTSEVLTLKGVSAPSNAERILDLLWAQSKADCDRCVERITRWLGPCDISQMLAPRLTPAQIRELRDAGVEIGAHSVSHPNLAVAPEDLTRFEMLESRRVLEEILQEPVTGFAYPGGRMHAATQHIAKGLGFAYALSTVTGINMPGYEMNCLRRIGMPDAELPDFRRAFSGALLRGPAENHLRF